jgi:pantoate--beta-alanine ligase
MQQRSGELHKEGKIIGFVPTMGYLHPGHISLIRKARSETDVVVLSIFVNPIQFSRGEDFKEYPRAFTRDKKIAQAEGVDIIFYPSAEAIYPPDYKTFVEVEKLSEVLCGASRPGHFRGVTTIVLKLFNLVLPDIAYFGQKDAQQALIIQQMVKDLALPVKLKILPTVREKDGLAMSSRNTYLSPSERQDARVLFQALQKAKVLVKKGIRRSSVIIKEMERIINQASSSKIDYIAIVNPFTLQPVTKIESKVLVALAVWIGKARLIDNTYLSP